MRCSASCARTAATLRPSAAPLAKTSPEIDFGRFLDTGAQHDLFVFRVPSLRNVAATAPYFHDGSVERLDDAVRKMGEIQLGETLTDEEVGLIVQFLHSLTGEYQGRPIVPQ